MRALIDTCIIIDALQAREPFFHDAQNVFLYAANCKYDGYITAKATADIYYIMHRSIHNDEQTKTVLGRLFKIFELLDSYGLDCRRALSSDTKDYEDAIMIETAIRSGMDCIVTRNLKDYENAKIPVYSPSDFIKLLDTRED